MRGRKRHIVVDTLGFLLAVLAHPADIQDRPGAVSLLPRLQGVVSRLAILYADSGYAGPMPGSVATAVSPKTTNIFPLSAKPSSNSR